MRWDTKDLDLSRQDNLDSIILNAIELVKELKSNNAAIPISAASALSSLESSLYSVGCTYSEFEK